MASKQGNSKPSTLVKEEKEHHRRAFEYYLAMGEKRNLREVAKEFNKSLTTIHNWSVSFDWKSRIEIRDAEMSKMLEKKTNETVTDIKAKYHTFLKAMLADAIQRFKKGEMKIESPLDLVRIMQMDLSLLGEGDQGKTGMLQEFVTAIDSGRAIYEEMLKQQAAASKGNEQ
ncbi:MULTISPECIES: hypothetical protein [Bacillus cereus group]|uniref:hypothetical protein n=1 Tax=Bacillus cereus group TaxID=86661 RepID=UPI0019656C1D|nr:MULTISPECIES: hypothetical protein [Bacillus cereus group]MBM6771571.1 hypothetical protein [Bacillus cereus]MCC2380844.1 hypothetical protein [Bacillus wiedmannii]MCC2424972.1 hypothetical protein [Bacillus wiedmannii]MCC2494427.1 hypothetical protein [Bacillus cereus]HDR8409161.1 hypothetical protein [Bacillus cereus]